MYRCIGVLVDGVGISVIEFIQQYQLGLYVCFLLLPLIQEDLAVFLAASATVSGVGNPVVGFLVVLIGLTASAALYYGIGYAAIRQNWARKFTENPKVEKAGEQVKTNLVKSLFVARFVPPVRIPFYLASGFFKLDFVKVLFFSVVSAILYIGIAFILFHLFGEAVGSQLKIYLPLVAVLLVLMYFLFRKMLRHKP